MYIVHNLTKTTIIIPDLNIEIGRNKIMDIEKIVDRASIEKSYHLKQAISMKKLQLIKYSSISAPVSPPASKNDPAPVINTIDEEKLASIVKQIMDENSDKHVATIDAKLNNIVHSNMNELMSALREKINQVQVPASQSNIKKHDDDLNIKVDHSKIAEAQQKSVEKMVNQIETNEQKGGHNKIRITNMKKINELADEL